VELHHRPFRPEDLDSLLAAMGAEGWVPSRAQLEALLAADPEGARVLLADGEPVGWVTTTALAESGWLGNLIVQPAFRRRGLGEELAASGIARLRDLGRETIRLEADPAGEGIYRRLGFLPEFESLRFRRPLGLDPVERGLSKGVDPLVLEGLSELLAFDRPRYGDDRSALLRALLPRAAGAFTFRRGRELAGFAMAVTTARGFQLGPWVAEDGEAAAALLEACLAAFPAGSEGGEWVVGLPEPNRAGVALLEAHGFAPYPASVRMRLGPPRAAGRPECVFGLLNGAVG